jgi:hypothetical protein
MFIACKEPCREIFPGQKKNGGGKDNFTKKVKPRLAVIAHEPGRRRGMVRIGLDRSTSTCILFISQETKGYPI